MRDEMKATFVEQNELMMSKLHIIFSTFVYWWKVLLFVWFKARVYLYQNVLSLFTNINLLKAVSRFEMEH